MTILKLIPLLIMTTVLFACGSENAPPTNTNAEKTSDILFEGQRKVLEDAKDVEKVLADEEHKRKDKMKELGL
jgi:type II restriction/modification system DNA methylase subunit YeeA